MSTHLFSVLAKNNIIDASSARYEIENMDTIQALELLGGCYDSIEEIDEAVCDSIFTFAPVSSIAGGKSPCESSRCRIEAAYSLSLFGTLYSDQLILPNFFDYFFHIIQNEDYPFSNEEQERRFKENFINDLAVYFQYKPLLDSGLAIINHATLTACADCQKRHLRSSDKFRKSIIKTLDDVTPKLRKDLKFVLTEPGYVAVVDETNYVGGVVGWALHKDSMKYMAKHAKQLPHILNRNQIQRLGLMDSITNDVVDDLLGHSFYPDLQKATYLTDRQIDIEIINKAKSLNIKTETQSKNDLYHNLPFLADVLIDDLVSLRQQESDSFNVYRDAITQLLRSDSQDTASEIVSSVLNPALNKIDLAISTNKKHYRARAGKKMAQGTTLAVIGATASSYLNIPAEALVNTLGVAGLSMGLGGTINDVTASRETPPDAINNQYYYLWKVKKIAHS